MQKNIAIIENNVIACNTIRSKLISELVEKSYNVTVLTDCVPQDIVAGNEKGFTVVNIGSSTQNPLDILRYLFKLYKGLKKSGADVCLTYTIRPAIWGNIVTRILKIPTITNITGIGPLFVRDDIAYRGARILYKFVLRKTKKIFFQNNDDMNIFMEKKFAQQSVVERVPGSGVDYEYYSPRGKRVKSDKFKFIFISRLVKDKGIVEYVEAARELKNILPNVEFNVLGPIWAQNLKSNTLSEADIDQWVREGVINYLGEAKDIRDYLAEMDCVVLPSYREGMSNVLLEGSSMGKPCITTNTTGCKEIVEDGVTGYLCRVQDATDLAEKMKAMTLLPEHIRIEMGDNARKKVIREFDKKIVIDAYIDAINKCIKG